MRAPFSFAAVLLIVRLMDGGSALALPSDVMATQSIGGMERVSRGAAFAAEDLLTGAAGTLATPRFDPSAGVFGSGGIQPAAAPPENLSGSYTVPPAVREVSASVMVADAFFGADDSPVSGGHAAAGNGARFSPHSTAALGPVEPGWRDRAASAGPGDAAESAALARRSGSLIRSSVFLNTPSGTAGRPRSAVSASGSSGKAAALGTVQGASSLTLYQATHADAAVPAGKTIESYSVAAPATGTSPAPAAATVRMPMKVTSSSYGFLNSSLTVFSDDFGTFAGVGQTFNGLTSLNIAEPASVTVMLGSLAGLAAIRRRRRRA